MVAVIFALLCWAAWHLSPALVEMLSYNKNSIVAGEWWRLWTAHFVHYTSVQLMIDSGVIAVPGLMMWRFSRGLPMFLLFVFAMPVILGPLMIYAPQMQHYRGPTGMAVLMWTMAGWFLIVESRRYSAKFWLGYLFLIVISFKVLMEAYAIYSPSVAVSSGFYISWLLQLSAVFWGMALFNGLHQLHLGRLKDAEIRRQRRIRSREKQANV